MLVGKNLQIAKTLIQQDLLSRYKGSVLGALWNWVLPLLMLGIYAFVFGSILKTKWPGLAETSELAFATNIFSGLLLVNLFADIVGRAPTLVVSNANLIKKVAFPVQLLPLGLAGSALVNAAVSSLFLLLLILLTGGSPSFAWLFIPVVLCIVVLHALGFAWAISACAAYLRDLAPVTVAALAALMFLTPVFYPISAVPQHWVALIYFNPLTAPVEMFRLVVVNGVFPDVSTLLTGFVASIFVAWTGKVIFNRLQEGFADVV
jgi:lipopolysaccharide transport system permease protein